MTAVDKINQQFLAGSRFSKSSPQMSFRKTEPTLAARKTGFKKAAVSQISNLLFDLIEKHKFWPKKIHNVDEIRQITVRRPRSKVISLRGDCVFVA
jgi:hypothetical protein